MMIDNDRIKLIALIGFVSTIMLGIDAFTVIVGLTLVYSFITPSAYLGLLFLSGTIKYAPFIKAFPIDITLLSYALFVVYFLFERFKKNTLTPNVLVVEGILGLCFLVVSISLLTTPAPMNYLSKSGLLIVLLYLPLVFMIVQLPFEQIQKNVQDLFRLLLLIGYAWVGLGLHNDIVGYSPLPPTDSWFSAFGEDYMVFALFTIPLLLEALIAFLFKKKHLINGILLCILTYCIMNSPARGLMISLIVSCIFIGCLFLFQSTLREQLSLLSLFTTVILGILIYWRFFISSKHELAAQRLSNFDLSGESIINRFTSIKTGWEHWSEQPFWGTGTDSIAFFNNSPGLYAHNLVLEALFEYGVLGSIPLFILGCVALLCFYIFIKRILSKLSVFATTITPVHESATLRLEIWLSGIFIVLFLVAMTSGSIGTMRTLWISIALIIGIGISRATSKKSVITKN